MLKKSNNDYHNIIMQENDKKYFIEKIQKELNLITKESGYLTAMAKNTNEGLIALDKFSLDEIYNVFKDPVTGCPTLLDLLEYAVLPREQKKLSRHTRGERMKRPSPSAIA